MFFTPKALTFLRALKRNNDGEWFRAHRADYVTHIEEPLHRLLETLNDDLHDVAPELACTARESTFRMYRDTRFSEDKTPLKTHVAWSLRPRGFPKGYAAGLYAQFDPSETWIGGGLYHPEPPVRTAEREHIAAHHRRLTAIVQAPAFRKHLGTLEGDTLTRVPRGFDPAHPAAEYLKFKDWMVSRSLPGDVRHRAGVLSDAAGHLPRRGPADPLPQRTDRVARRPRRAAPAEAARRRARRPLAGEIDVGAEDRGEDERRGQDVAPVPARARAGPVLRGRGGEGQAAQRRVVPAPASCSSRRPSRRPRRS